MNFSSVNHRLPSVILGALIAVAFASTGHAEVRFLVNTTDGTIYMEGDGEITIGYELLSPGSNLLLADPPIDTPPDPFPCMLLSFTPEKFHVGCLGGAVRAIDEPVEIGPRFEVGGELDILALTWATTGATPATVTYVPEPSAWYLLGIGFCTLSLTRR